ncbi:hypothetical protein ACFL18_02160 [Patescibacteria group bacterium]
MKLNGYRATHRNKWLLIKERILNIQELALLEFYADLVGFDKDNSNYGLFKVSFKKIAELFNCKSINTSRNWHNKLLKLGLIKKTEEKQIYSLSCFKRYITPGRWKGEAAQYVELEKNQPVGVMLQNIGINTQLIGQKTQSVDKKKSFKLKKSPPIAISSSKVQSSISPKKVVIKQKARSDGEYQRIYEEGGYSFLKPDYMKWLDKNVQSEEEITEEITDKDLVEIFFDGDWDSFNQNVVYGN